MKTTKKTTIECNPETGTIEVTRSKFIQIRDEKLMQCVEDGKLSEEIIEQEHYKRDIVYQLMKKDDKTLSGKELNAILEPLTNWIGCNYKTIQIVEMPSFKLDIESGSLDVNDSNIDDSNIKTIVTSSRQLKLTRGYGKNGFDHLYLYQAYLFGDKNDTLIIRCFETNLNKKKSITFTISENIMDDFNNLADKLAINKSKFVENSIKAFIEKNR